MALARAEWVMLPSGPAGNLARTDSINFSRSVSDRAAIILPMGLLLGGVCTRQNSLNSGKDIVTSIVLVAMSFKLPPANNELNASSREASVPGIGGGLKPIWINPARIGETTPRSAWKSHT